MIQQMSELATQKAFSVNGIGWHHSAYVHPRTTFDPNSPRMVLQTKHLFEGLTQQDSSDSWREQIGRYCLNNPLQMVGVCAAF
ncbi:DUF927 domain-containing protein [Litoribacillus peritrichatus]|uniref:DUF927 domain-containing protein n=1 Tax=Litoribacillus peritrichatus TaxID=718191 RepID=A0ABP7NCC6_9GAMM